MKYKYTKHKVKKLFKTSEQNIYDVNVKENKDFALKAQTLLFKNVKVLHSDTQNQLSCLSVERFSSPLLQIRYAIEKLK